MFKRTAVKSRRKSTVRTLDWKTTLGQGGSSGSSSAGQDLSWCWPTPHLVFLPHDFYSPGCCQLCWEILQCAQFTDENDKLDGDMTNLICIWISYTRGKKYECFNMPPIPYQWPGSWQRGPLRKSSTIILAFELYTGVICCTMGSAEFPRAALTSSWWAVLTPLAGAGLDCSAHPVPLSCSMLLTKSPQH